MLQRIHSQQFTPDLHHNFVLMSSFQFDTAFGEEQWPQHWAGIVGCVAYVVDASQGPNAASGAWSSTFIETIAYIAFVTPKVYALSHLSHATNAMLHTYIS